MTREQAINYLISSGFSDEQVSEVVRALTYEPTPKNDSSELEKNSKKLEKDFGELDCISREQALRELKESAKHHANDSREEVLLRRDRDIIRALPSVTPQEPQTFKWCRDCKEYDQENHCCHRWSKVIRDTVEEMKQEYSEREVLDKIDEIITDALDNSTDQKESQTLRWVLDKISEVM